MTYLKKHSYIALILAILLPFQTAFVVFTLPPSTIAPYTLELEATVSESPVSITIEWPKETGVTNYEVYRKNKDATSWGSILATVPFNAGATTYTYVDTNVSVGTGYDYRVVKNNSGSPSIAYGYIYAGIKLPVVESRGKLILVVDNTYESTLATEINELKADLAGDGWTVLTHYVARNATKPSVKALIQADYAADPTNVKAVLLLGKVPVPYSGQLKPDGHANHLGAWPTDQYYGDMSDEWTDIETWPNSSDSRQTNIAGDGKFDQSNPPSEIDLQVGRIDLSGMTAFASQTETQLLQQYLAKNHNYKHKVISPTKRGVLLDGFGVYGGEAFALGGWRNFSALFGSANITSSMSNYFNTLSTDSYAWTFAVGPGNSSSLGGLGTTVNYVTNAPRSVFNMFFGSYFGDWEYNNSFMKAPLASAGWGLVSVWTARPQWHMYHMALGEPVGYSARLTQNSTSLFQSLSILRDYDGQVHTTLLGDPTLRTDIVSPVSNVVAAHTTENNVDITWTASADSGLSGYHIYRSTSQYGPYTKVTSSPVVGTSHTDTVPYEGGTFYYMVRAVKLESTVSGSYYNQSQGIMSSSVSVGETNQAPVIADLSSTETITFTADLDLDASVTDDELPTDTLITTWSHVSGPATTTFEDASAVDTTVSFSQEGVYVIRLTADDGDLSSTFDITVTVSSDITAPSAPASLEVSNIAETSTRLTWTAATDDTAVTGYTILRDGSLIGTTTNLYYEDSGLTRATNYTYKVQAFDAASNDSTDSNEVTITTSSSASTRSSGGGSRWYGDGSTTTTNQSTTPSAQPSIIPSVSKFIFTKNLKPGVQDEEVRNLQKYLNAKGFVLALTGPGSIGNETSIFGPGTKAALLRLQSQIKYTTNPLMIADGLVGPQMRLYLNSN